MKNISQYFGVPGFVLLLSGIVCLQIFWGDSYRYIAFVQIVLGLVLAVLYSVFYVRDMVTSVARSKPLIFGAFGALLALAILILVNVVANTKLEGRKDLTENKVYSLSSDSISVLKNLKDEIEIVAFVPDGSREKMAFEDLMEQYRTYGSKLKVSSVDPDKAPQEAKKFSAKSKEVVINNPAKKKNVKITEISEEALSSAIKKVLAAQQRTICFLMGHGERDLKASQSDEGFSVGKDLVENEGLLTKEVNLSQTPSVSQDCAVLAVVGPQKTLRDDEVKTLTQYYREGGNLVLLLDPMPNLKKDALMSFGFESWLGSKGIELANAILIARGRDLLGREVLTLGATSGGYGKGNEITGQMTEENITEFALARPLILGKAKNDKDKDGAAPQSGPQMLVETAASGWWAETDIGAIFQKSEKLRSISWSPGKLKGGMAIGALLEEGVAPDVQNKRGEKSRLVVFGNSGFVSNQGISRVYNRDLLLNTLSYCAGEEKGLAIRARKIRSSTINITLEQQKLIFFASVFLIPQLIIIFGAWVWMYRRKR